MIFGTFDFEWLTTRESDFMKQHLERQNENVHEFPARLSFRGEALIWLDNIRGVTNTELLRGHYFN